MELKTQADVFRLRVEKDKSETVYYDRGQPKHRVAGLALRVRPASRTWVLYYRWAGPQYRLTIGDATALTLDDARREARRWHRVMLDEKKNPVEVQRLEKARKDAKPTAFRSVMEQYLAARQKDLKPRSYVECERHLERDWKPLHAMDLNSIDRGTVAAQLNVIERQSGAAGRNRARSTLSSLFGWAIQEGHEVDNPVTGTRKSEEPSRDRVLSNAELAAIWIAADETDDYGRIVRMLMLTGQRREEIGGLLWSEIQTDAQCRKLIALPGHRTKNSRPHDVPLSAEALIIVEGIHRIQGRPHVFGIGGGGFSGWSKSKERLDDALRLPEWRLHDLRRTVATRMADSPGDGGLGIQPHVIEAILNHVSGHKAGVAGIYNRSTYAAEKRVALDAWAKHLAVLVAQASGANVVAIRRPK